MGKSLQTGFAPIILFFALVVIGGGSIIAVKASQNSLPGEPLYKVKGFVEQVELQTSRTNEAKARIYLKIANERLEEIEKLQEKGAPTELISQTLEDYQENQKKALELLGQSQPSEQKEEVVEEVKKTAKKQDEVVKKVLEKAPEGEKEKIEKVAEEAKKDAEESISTQSATPTPAPASTNTSATPTLTPTATSPSQTTSPTSTPRVTPTPAPSRTATPIPTARATSTPIVTPLPTTVSPFPIATPTLTVTPVSYVAPSLNSISPNYIYWGGNTRGDFQFYGSNLKPEGNWRVYMKGRDRSPFIKSIQLYPTQWTNTTISSHTIYSWEFPVKGQYVDVYLEFQKVEDNGKVSKTFETGTVQVRFSGT